MKILLVDNDKFIRDSFGARLLKNKHKVTYAKNGGEAIDKITTNDFDVVIIDIENPKLSELEVIKFIKNNKPKTKVIIMSCYVNTKVINKAVGVGADKYIGKSSFLKDIDKILDKIT